MSLLKTTFAIPALSLLALAGLTVSATAAHLANPNLLSDPSFEGVITPGGGAGPWISFSADGDEAAGADTASFTTTSPRTGAQSLEMSITAAANVFAGTFQDVNFGPGLAGTQAWFSGWHALGAGPGGSEIRIEWRDSVANVEISRTANLTTSAAGPAYEEFVISDAIPAGADSARLVYAIQSFGGPADQSVFVDDANFNIDGVPEPSSAILAGLAGMGLILRRRRR